MMHDDLEDRLSASSKSLPAQPWCTANVVCVSYNNRETITQLLDSLLVEAKHIAEVVIHDNGSSDTTVELARAWRDANPGLQLHVVESSNVGFSSGVYGGSQKFQDTNLPTLCLNPDAILAPGTVNALLNVLQDDHRIGIATAPLLMSDGSMDPSCVRTLPKFGSSVLYAILGKLLPRKLRYNSARLEEINHADTPRQTGSNYRQIEATTGALMLINPLFRNPSQPIFDLSYWMYGEDLQLCKDAADEGYVVAMVDFEPSIHVKGVSSGWPRSSKSNRAFHDALYVYYSKNFSRGPFDRALGKAAVGARLALSELMGRAERARKLFAR